MPTVPCASVPPAPVPTLDDVVAAGLCASELSTARAYQTFCGGSLVTWIAKIRVSR